MSTLTAPSLSVAAVAGHAIAADLHHGFRTEQTGGGCMVLRADTLDGFTVCLTNDFIVAPDWTDSEVVCCTYAPGEWEDTSGTGQHDAAAVRQTGYDALTPAALDALIVGTLADARTAVAAR